MRRACARTLGPRTSLPLEHGLQPTPSPLCGLASWALWQKQLLMVLLRSNLLGPWISFVKEYAQKMICHTKKH